MLFARKLTADTFIIHYFILFFSLLLILPYFHLGTGRLIFAISRFLVFCFAFVFNSYNMYNVYSAENFSTKKKKKEIQLGNLYTFEMRIDEIYV